MHSNKIRLALGIEYSGSSYKGWQSQKDVNIPTIQRKVETALSKIAAQEIMVIVAGRTDARVHATNQIVHADVPVNRNISAWLNGTNKYLPNNIRITWAKFVPNDFNARYSALSRSYKYLIYNHPIKPALWEQRASWVPVGLDCEAMKEACKYWIGEHDFAAFQASSCQSITSKRCINSWQVDSYGPWLVLAVNGNAFLHHMVRNMVGTLIVIGKRKRSISWAKTVLESCDRRQAGMTAEAIGLYLVNITYPDKYMIPGPSSNFFNFL